MEIQESGNLESKKIKIIKMETHWARNVRRVLISRKNSLPINFVVFHVFSTGTNMHKLFSFCKFSLVGHSAPQAELRTHPMLKVVKDSTDDQGLNSQGSADGWIQTIFLGE